MVHQTATQSRFPHVLIRASAGTGKTFRLSNHYIGLLEAEAEKSGAVAQILASTFTRKAAGEILERVILRLAHAALDDKKCLELDGFLKLAGFLEQKTLDRNRCLTLVQTLTRQLHRIRISTLDSFFGQIARSFSLELGISPGWEIVDQLADDRLRSLAIARVLSQNETRDLMRLMNLLTKGETTRSVTELIRSTVNELYELFQETKPEAWHSLARPKPLPASQVAQLIESLSGIVFTDKRFQTARDGDIGHATSGDWETFIEKGLANKVLDGVTIYYKKPIPDDAVQLYQQLLAHAKAEIVGRVASQTEGTYELLLKFHLEYQQIKQERGALRFDDITRKVAAGANEMADRQRAAVTGISQPALAYRLDSQVTQLLLDEFQDTSPTQWQAVRPVAQRAVEPGGRGSFFCVGDVKQAIYGWRGGVAEIFDAITDELPGLESQSLNCSYRSSPVVIETVNQIFANMTQHGNLERAEPAVRTWCQKFEPHETAKQDLPGYAVLETAPDKDEGDDEKPIFEFTAKRVAEIVRQAPGCSVGILVRKNETVGRLIYELGQQQIHASEEGGNPLTDSAAVQLVLSLLRLVDHPGDTVARFHLIHSPLAVALDCATLDDATTPPFAQQVRLWLQTHGYGPLLYDWTKRLAASCNRRELSRLVQLVDLAYEYQSQATLRTDDFIAFVEQQRVADPTAADVRVMTVHQAKGLEFDVVVLPELDVQLTGQPGTFVVHRETATSPVSRVCRYVNQDIQKLLPEAVQKMFEHTVDRSVAESLCVLYVALTRAVHALHLIIKPSTKSEKNLPKTYAGLLRAALAGDTPLAPETVAFETGNRQWFQTLATATHRPTATAANAATVPFRVPLAPNSDRPTRGLERISPSGLEGGGAVRLSSLFQERKGAALVRGTLIHAWFEAIEWLDGAVPDDETLRRIAVEKVTDLDAQALDLSELIRQFHKMLARPAVAATLSRASYAAPAAIGFSTGVAHELAAQSLSFEVLREYDFAVRNQGDLMAGSIDRLVLISAGTKLLAADILDFKTDTVDAQDPQALATKREFYLPQITAYRSAISQMTGLVEDHILTRLLFVGAGVVV